MTSDAYNTVWTHLFWGFAVVMVGLGFFVMVGSFFIREIKVRDGLQAMVVALVIAGSLYGVGLLVRGSYIRDDLKAANEAVGRATVALEDANVELCGHRACP